jgi:probable HAF family extracellular repeat protein
MTDLGPGYANGINNAGQVVGNTGGFLGDAVLYSNGQMTDLGTLPGPSTTSVRWWGVPSNSPAVVLSPFTPFFTRTGK